MFDFREVVHNEKRFKIAIEQLTSAGASLEALQTKLDEIQPKLQICVDEIAELTEKIELEKEKVTELEAEVFADQEKADEQVIYLW